MYGDHGTFTSLVFALNGGVGTEFLIFHEHLVDRIASESNDRYETVLRWISRKLLFLVLRERFLCIQGSRSCNNTNNLAVVNDFQLV